MRPIKKGWSKGGPCCKRNLHQLSVIHHLFALSAHRFPHSQPHSQPTIRSLPLSPHDDDVVQYDAEELAFFSRSGAMAAGSVSILDMGVQGGTGVTSNHEKDSHG